MQDSKTTSTLELVVNEQQSQNMSQIDVSTSNKLDLDTKFHLSLLLVINEVLIN